MGFKIDESARIYGEMSSGDGLYIAQGSVVRSDGGSVSFGNNSWILENSVIIGNKKYPAKIGSKTVLGHKCIVIGAEIGDLCEVGNGTIFLPGSKVGNMCIFGEGTIIPQGVSIPDKSVVIGRPYRIIRTLTQEDIDMIKRMRGGDISITKVDYKELTGREWEDNIVGKLNAIGGKIPVIKENVVIFDGAEINGDVRIGNNSKVYSGVKIIGNSHGPVIIGNNVQIMENSVLHLLPDNELIIEDNVTIGPGCIVHGCHIGSGTIIESGSIICDYSKVGRNSLVKSGSLVKQRSIFEENEILEGFPAKSIGKNT